MKFQEIEPIYYRATLDDIKEANGSYGRYFRFIFTIIEGDLIGYRFSGFLKPSFLKQDKLYRWVNALLDAPPSEFSPDCLVGKECLVFLSKNNDRNFYAVTNIKPISEFH